MSRKTSSKSAADGGVGAARLDALDGLPFLGGLAHAHSLRQYVESGLTNSPMAVRMVIVANHKPVLDRER
jgi:hypothetical protein